MAFKTRKIMIANDSLLDPNPYLIDIDDNLINNINLAAKLATYGNGTIADGISKLILIVESKNSLQFSINDTKHNNPTNVMKFS